MTDMTADSQHKHALLIGINEYLNFPNLEGCINDIELMAKVLQENFGFPEEAIHRVRNGEATRDGILAAMENLTDRVETDDVVVIHYSGHGSQKLDLEGDEPDRYDETIVPYDSGRRPYENRDITDDKIYEWLLELSAKTGNITLIFDSCHAATIVRDTFGVAIRRVPSDDREVETAENADRPAPKRRRDGPSGWLPVSDRYVLIAGCRDQESSCEYHKGKTTHGALTFFLCEELARAQPGTTYRDVFERMAPRVSRRFSIQHPQLEGTRDRVLFGVEDIQPMRFIPVIERRGNRLELGAGAAHGLRRGSQWALYPSGTKSLEESPERLGLAEITDVGAVAAYARIVEEATEISVGARAVEEAHNYGEMRLVVELAVPDEALHNLIDRIEGSALLRLAKNGERGDVRVYLAPPRDPATASDPVPQMNALQHSTWLVANKGGEPLMPPIPAHERGALERLIANLETRARFLAAFDLENVDDASVLHGKVEMTILRQAPNGTFVPAEPDGTEGEIRFCEGERLALRLNNKHDAPVYVAVLDFGLTGGISQIYPVTGAREALAPDEEREREFFIGTRLGQELELYFPRKFPFVPNAPRRGTEYLKLFATTAETDFTPLVQGRFRKAAGQSPLGQLLALALSGRGMREVRNVRNPLNEDWTTVTKSFVLSD